MADPALRNDPIRSYPAEKARQGRIVLNTPLRRLIFMGGLAMIVILALISTIPR